MSATADEGVKAGSRTAYVLVVLGSAVLQLLAYGFFAALQRGADEDGDLKHPAQDFLFAIGAVTPAIMLLLLSLIRVWFRCRRNALLLGEKLPIAVVIISCLIIAAVIGGWIRDDLVNIGKPW
jgi:hypothetical protein